jgi:hypothetical protein
MVEKARAANEPRYKLLGADELRDLPPLADSPHAPGKLSPL